ncbi:TOBE domain-containing protein [Streptosporangium subroseum]|uniref:TOBE domain-containing protein n=1 Tax=Streptosporangium subroseum TaxID=106412 RepID=UPI00308D1E58|nr:TOBE domain-containing protein [Streptosporangium subroseum]
MLLDEPFSALDAELRGDARRAVTAALAATRTTTVLVTHDQGEALSLADQVAVMSEGHLVQVGSPSTVYATPADPAVARFVGDAVLLPAVITGRTAQCALGALTVRGEPAQGPAQVLIRPEQIEILDDDAGVPTVVGTVTYFGHDATVDLTIQPHGPDITARVSGTRTPRPGTPVHLAVNGLVTAFAERET